VLSILLIALTIGGVAFSQGDILSGKDVAELTKDMAQKLQFNSEGIPVGFIEEEEHLAWIFESLKHEVAYRVIDESGAVVLTSAAGETLWPTEGAVSRLERQRFEFEHADVTLRGATEIVERENRKWFLQVAVSTRFMQLMYRAFALPFTGAGIVIFSLVLFFVFGVCAFITLRYTLRPLRTISESALSISPHSIHTRLSTQAVPLEIAPLVNSFNQVLERLDRGYSVQQEFLANAAHELKTPLALIRAQIELSKVDETIRKSLLQDVEYMTRQVQQLLLLAEASEMHNYKFTTVNVPNLVREVVSYLARMADMADVTLDVIATEGDVLWKADQGALITLMKNLIENAIQHAPAKTAVHIEIGKDTITVRDIGPGVDAEQLPLLFKRFWRGVHRRDHGAGLGLAICHEIAMAHGWLLTAERAEPGLRFRLSRC
jgi:two-component system, OmpR family, sensor histidine kinase QseC